MKVLKKILPLALFLAVSVFFQGCLSPNKATYSRKPANTASLKLVLSNSVENIRVQIDDRSFVRHGVYRMKIEGIPADTHKVNVYIPGNDRISHFDQTYTIAFKRSKTTTKRIGVPSYNARYYIKEFGKGLGLLFIFGFTFSIPFLL